MAQDDGSCDGKTGDAGADDEDVDLQWKVLGKSRLPTQVWIENVSPNPNRA
jgi:hypothetical protein